MTSLILQLLGLAEPLGSGDPIKIKRLDWHTGRSPLGITTRMARLPFDGGWLRIDGPGAVRWQRRLQEEAHEVFVPGPFRGIRAAEQAAQTEYERRILSAVERAMTP